MEQGWNQKIAALYRERRDYLYRVAYRILGRQSDAEDAVHTAFVRLLRMKEHYDALASDELCYLAVCIVKHAALNMLRDEKKRRPYGLGQELLEMSESTAQNAGPLRMTHLSDRTEDMQRDRVRETLYRMPDEQCRLLWMKYYAGMSGQDIATALHISRHAAEMRLHRAKREFEKKMKEERNDNQN